MPINRNPKERAQVEPEQCWEAQEHFLRPINVIINPPDHQSDDQEMAPISFFIYSHFIPSRGDTIALQDGKTAIVNTVLYKIMTRGKTGFLSIVPNLLATVKA